MKNRLLPFLIILSSIIFILRLLWIQVIDINDVTLSNKNSVEKVFNFPERGYIYDRNNKLIVGNELFYDLMVVPSKLKLIDTLEFCEILKIDKGTLKKGADGDMCIFDLEAPWKLDAEKLKSKSKNTAIEDRKLQGKVLMTFLNGELVFSK